MTIPRPLVTGPSAWIGAELAKRPEEWIYTLSADEIGEIQTNVAHLRGRDIASVTQAEFPLPTLGPVLDRLRDEILNGRGFVLLRGLPVSDKPIADSAMAYWGIGTWFGSARSQNAKGHVLGHVRDMGLATTDPNVRIYQTTERQNFHTDSCDIVGLVCLKTARSGGLSSLTSSMSVYNAMCERTPGGSRWQKTLVRTADLQRLPRVFVGAVCAALRPVLATFPRGAAPDRGRH